MLRNRLVLAAIILSVIDPISLGAIDLLVPRHLHGNGVPTWHIGAALMVGAAIGAVAGPLVGRRADRIGPLRVGLIAATALVALPTILILGLSDPLLLVVLVAVAPAFTMLSTAMYPLSTSGADARGVSHGVVNGVISVTWATAFAVGSLASGVLADHHGDTVDLHRRRRRVRIAAGRARDHRPRHAARRSGGLNAAARPPRHISCSSSGAAASPLTRVVQVCPGSHGQRRGERAGRDELAGRERRVARQTGQHLDQVGEREQRAPQHQLTAALGRDLAVQQQLDPEAGEIVRQPSESSSSTGVGAPTA